MILGDVGEHIFLALIATVTAIRVAPANSADGESICFKTHRDDGLSFPMTGAMDAGQLISHGPHCLMMVDMFIRSPPINVVDQMHFDHCHCLASRMLRYVEEFPGGHYMIPEQVCKDIKAVHTDISNDADYYATYNYAAYAFGNVTDAERPKFVYGELRRIVANDAEMLGITSGHNLGTLLLADYLGEDLTPAERRVVHQWSAGEVVRLGAVGVTCMGVGHDGRHGPSSPHNAGPAVDRDMGAGSGGSIDHGGVHSPAVVLHSVLDRAPAPVKVSYCKYD